MTTMKRAHLFGGPKRMRRAKERTERVQLLRPRRENVRLSWRKNIRKAIPPPKRAATSMISHRRDRRSPPTSGNGGISDHLLDFDQVPLQAARTATRKEAHHWRKRYVARKRCQKVS